VEQACKTQCLLQKKPVPAIPRLCATLRRLIEITCRQQQTQRTLLEWLRAEYGIEKSSNKLLPACA
jgi:hypothetical protein